MDFFNPANPTNLSKSRSDNFVGPVRLELTTPGVKDRYSKPIELRTSFVAVAGITVCRQAGNQLLLLCNNRFLPLN